jgi:hypothetical protein
MLHNIRSTASCSYDSEDNIKESKHVIILYILLNLLHCVVCQSSISENYHMRPRYSVSLVTPESRDSADTGWTAEGSGFESR